VAGEFDALASRNLGNFSDQRFTLPEMLRVDLTIEQKVGRSSGRIRRPGILPGRIDARLKFQRLQPLEPS
jgi:hypothetical protein